MVFTKKKKFMNNYLRNFLEEQLIECFINDNIENLKQLLPKINNIDLTFSSSFLPSDAFLFHSPPIISVAAFYKSEKCFNLIIENGADLYKTDSFKVPVSHFAIKSGSINILKILDNHNYEFPESCLFLSSELGNYSIFMWLYSTQFQTLKIRNIDKSTLLKSCIKGKNKELFSFLMEELTDFLDILDILEIKNELSKNNFNEEENSFEEEELN